MLIDDLRRNSVLRQYLHVFDERDWAEVVRLTALIGVHALRLSIGSDDLTTVTIDRVREICLQGAAVHTVQDALPDLEQTLEHVRAEISSLKGEISATSNSYFSVEKPRVDRESVPVPAKQAAGWRNDALQSKNREARSQYSRQTVHGLGDSNASVQSLIYDDATVMNRKLSHKKSVGARRQPPRLAYSVISNDKMQLLKDDLVTSRYIDVPSSGYGTEGDIPVKQTRSVSASASQQLAPFSTGTKQRVTKDRSIRQIPVHLRKVQSKIKERVQHDRTVAAEHRSSRLRAMRNVAQRGSDHQRPSAAAIPVRHEKVHEVKTPAVMDIAESFLSDPMMSSFTATAAPQRRDFDPYNLAQSQSPDHILPRVSRAPESAQDLAAKLSQWISGPAQTAPSSAVPNIETLERLHRMTVSSQSVDSTMDHRSSAKEVFEASGVSRASQWSISPDEPPRPVPSGSAPTWTIPIESTSTDHISGEEESFKHRLGTDFSDMPDSVEWNFDQIISEGNSL